MARPVRKLKLSREDHVTLKRWVRSRTIDNALATRARIILATQKGESAPSIAKALGISARNVYKWVWRFDKEGLEELKEKRRSGRPRKLSLDDVMVILTKTVEQDPPGETHPSPGAPDARLQTPRNRKPLCVSTRRTPS